MKSIGEKTKTYKMFKALTAGDKLTASQALKRFGIKNIRAEATRIRTAGFVVTAEHRKAGNGVHVTEYQLGQPTRELIAAGYKAMRAGLV